MRYIIFSLITLLSPCCFATAESELFGIRESVWNSLTSEERKLAITGYNERQFIEAQIRLKELEAESRNGPVNKLVCALTEADASPRISAIQKDQITLNNGISFGVCPFIGNETKHWMPGSRVQVQKGEFGIWDMILKNLDTGDQVKAKRL